MIKMIKAPLLSTYLVIRRLSKKLGDPLRLGIDGERDLPFDLFTELAAELGEELRLDWLLDREDLELPL